VKTNSLIMTAMLLVGVIGYSPAQQADLPKAPVKAHPARPPVKIEQPFMVKTVSLHHLTSMEAVKLLTPYVQTPGGGVYEVSPNIRAVTVREIQAVFNEMQTVLERYDRDPATIVLNFQLIAAENTNTRDPAVASLDTLLRSVLKFTGYRLLTTSVAAATEGQGVTQTLSADGDPLTLTVIVRELRTEGSDASVQLIVQLNRQGIPASAQNNGVGRPMSELFSTGVRVPIGQTVVLGTSAVEGGQRAMILTVRPQLSKK
jgi:hypothetical protein